ncbi:alpha-N-acetylgalactosamine-specific lectin-like, partial [Anneissia japonica]|uniref:alpha-N-acetylgalactosamine-specific lectin-like n=1 Tax=Anneissia japonica TaxID=1529436 RepID=UPI00142586A8
VLLLFIFIAIAASPSDGSFRDRCKCPRYWVPFRRSCYRVFSYLRRWHEAEAHCKSFRRKGRQGHLVSIESHSENNFVSTLWRTSYGRVRWRKTYWIGLKRHGHSWRWSDFSPFRYTRWGRRQPSNGRRQNCVHQQYRRSSYLTWNDNRCWKKLSYVCEIEKR